MITRSNSRAQRKMKRQSQKPAKTNQKAIQQMMDKETKLKFDKELVKVKPFKVSSLSS